MICVVCDEPIKEDQYWYCPFKTKDYRHKDCPEWAYYALFEMKHHLRSCTFTPEQAERFLRKVEAEVKRITRG